MPDNSVVGYISWICQWIMRFAYINLLWLLFSIVGGIIFGVAPATIALFSIQRKWIKGHDDIPVFSTFLQQYKEHFIKGNISGFFLALIGWLIYFDLKFFMEIDILPFKIISLIIYILSIWYMLMLLFIVPVYVNYELKLMQNIKYAFIVGILNPLRTIATITCGGGALFLMLYFPKLIFFFGLSLPCFIIMFFSDQMFEKVEHMRKVKDIQV